MAEAKPGAGRAIVLPAALAALGFGLAGLFLSTFLGDKGALAFGLGAGWCLFTLGRVAGHFDLPPRRGVFVRHVLTGAALGFGGVAFLHGLFREGPGWPWTPWWLLLAGFGFGLYRSHRALLKEARAGDATAPKLWGLLHRKDLEALVALLLGYAILGVALFLFFRAFAGFLPGAGRILAIGVAIYALQGARLLLGFASEERGQTDRGFVAWLKANALQNAIVVLVLVAYAAFRTQLAATFPFFPLIEYGLGIAVFAFVLARLRARLRREGALLATASTTRDHERVVSELRETDYDAVARPVTRFVETGLGASDYADAVTSSLAREDARAEALRARIRDHREPPRPPPLQMEWELLAGGAMSLGLAIGAMMLGFRVLRAEMPYPLHLALMLVAFGLYAQQDVARSHHRPRLAFAIAAGGAVLLFLDFLLFAAQVASLADVPAAVWGIAVGVVAVMIAIPAIASWRLAKRLREGRVVDARRVGPALEVANELQRTRKRAATLLLVAFIALLPLPWLADWLAGRGFIPSGFPPFLRDVLAVAIWVLAAFGASALVRFYGLTRSRPQVLARERAKRERRLALHRDVMQALERA